MSKRTVDDCEWEEFLVDDKNHLNIWKNNWWSASHVIRNLRWLFRKIKWSFQRIKYGFCDYDVWDLDMYLSSIIYRTLLRLDKCNSFSCMDITKSDDENEALWHKYLMDTAKHFRNASINDYSPLWFENDKVPNEELKKLFKESKFKPKEELYFAILSEYANSEINKGLKMLGKHFFNLWD